MFFCFGGDGTHQYAGLTNAPEQEDDPPAPEAAKAAPDSQLPPNHSPLKAVDPEVMVGGDDTDEADAQVDAGLKLTGYTSLDPRSANPIYP